jgi:hypothetical protein
VIARNRIAQGRRSYCAAKNRNARTNRHIEIYPPHLPSPPSPILLQTALSRLGALSPWRCSNCPDSSGHSKHAAHSHLHLGACRLFAHGGCEEIDDSSTAESLSGEALLRLQYYAWIINKLILAAVIIQKILRMHIAGIRIYFRGPVQGSRSCSQALPIA